MTVRAWSFVLQWSRVGIGAALFLVAARYLTLAEIGVFATAYAPIRLTQGIHKVGVSECAVILGQRRTRLEALFIVGMTSACALSMLALSGAWLFSVPLLASLATIPVLHGLGAVSEGILRARLNMRALALRTLAGQGTAATVALWMLQQGHGVTALVTFAVLQAGLTCVLSVLMARWRPSHWPSLPRLAGVAAETARLAGRDLLTTGLIPFAQLVVGLGLGMSVAGAFQIATRLVALVDALTLAPLRFVALPQLRRDMETHPTNAIATQMRISCTVGVWAWCGLFIAAPEILALSVGQAHVSATTPFLRALVLMGLTGSVLMPLVQALIARGFSALVLIRAALMVGAFLGLATLSFQTSWPGPAIAGALSLSAAFSGVWLIKYGLAALQIDRSVFKPLGPPLISGSVMSVVLLLSMPHLALLPAAFSLATQVLSGSLVFGLCLLALRQLTVRKVAA